MPSSEDTRLAEALSSQDWATAERILKRRTAKSKASPADHFNLGVVQIEMGRYARALAPLKRAAKMTPQDVVVWLQLGRAALGAEDLAVARTAFARAHALDPGNPVARSSHGKLSLRFGDWQAAEAALSGLNGAEAAALAYRAAAERGAEGARDCLHDLLKRPETRSAAMKAMAKTARGRIPLRLPRADVGA